MTDIQLTDGSPVPADRSHTRIRPDGQQEGYVVLSPEERAKGFVKPVRRSYVHAFPSEVNRRIGCGVETRMSIALAETYARDPRFYSGTYCVGCMTHFPLNQFVWDDGEPMDPDLQEAWAVEHAAKVAREKEERRQRRIAELRRELAQLESEVPARADPR